MQEIIIPPEAQSKLRKDKVLAPLVDELTLSFQLSRGSVYEDLIEAIIYQQISIKAAASIFRKFTSYFGETVPSPAELAQVPLEELRQVGLSGQKAQYTINIARFFEDRQLSNSDFDRLNDQEITRLLCEIKGVGLWTAQMILIFSLGRPDVFPVLDYGIRTAMQHLYNLPAVQPKKMNEICNQIAGAWSPYRTYATLLLWSWKRSHM